MGNPRRPRSAAVATWGLLGALAAVGACGSPGRPPWLLDVVPPGVLDGGESFNFDAQLTAPTCNLGPEGGVCACVDQQLLGAVPNLYFVLDRSASMLESNKWGLVKSALADLVVALGPRVNVGVAVFPDPARDSCAPGVEEFATQHGDAPAGRPGPVVNSMLAALRYVSASGGTPTAATLQALAPRIQSLPGQTYVILATDGGPNCNPSATCGMDPNGAGQCQVNIESADPGCTPGGPVNCCTGTIYGGAQSCLDSAPTIDAVTALAKSVPVYVLGVPGSAPYATLLDQLAQAGGTARTGEPQYYAVDMADQSVLLAALKKIAASIAGTCTLKLDGVPPDPTLVNVFLDERVLPQSGADGWTLADDTVTILGASCQAIQGGDVLDVRIVAGCPTVLL